MYDNKLSVFLSHSHKDIEKVRKIRDLLELMECEPIMFFLKCLDDENGELEEFIKREIDARSVFLYCKSQNAENSVWVQKELSYIKSFPDKRWGEISIDGDFTGTMINFLISIRSFVKRNRVFITYCDKDAEAVKSIREYCANCGYGTQLRMHGTGDFAERSKSAIRLAAKDGILIFMISENSLKSMNFIAEVNYALGCADSLGGIVLPVIVGETPQKMPVDFMGMNYIKVGKKPTNEELENLVRNLTRINN